VQTNNNELIHDCLNNELTWTTIYYKRLENACMLISYKQLKQALVLRKPSLVSQRLKDAFRN
jgi:hypothetical protein